MKRRTVAIFIITGLIANATSAADYYVASTGNDTNSGTSPNQPWKSVAKVNTMMSTFSTKSLTENVTIYFNNADTWTMATNQELDITCKGAAGRWITFDGETWGTGSNAKLTRNDSKAFVVDVSYSANTDAYIVFKGFEVNGNGNVTWVLLHVENANYVQALNNKIHNSATNSWCPGIRFVASAGAGTIHDLEARNNEIWDVSAHGIAVYPDDSVGSANVIIKNNKIYNFGIWSGSAYAAGIQLMSCVGGDISGNTITHGNENDGYGINLEQRIWKCANINIYNNLIYGGTTNQLKYGFENDGGTNINFYGNIIHGVFYESVRWGGDHGGASGKFFNNTIYHTNSVRPAIYVHNGGVISELRNNLVYVTSAQPALSGKSGVSQHSNNLFYNTVAGRAVVDSLTTSQWISQWEPTGKNGDPGFENGNSLPSFFDANWKTSPTGLRIKSNGAAYRGGTNLSSIFTHDIDGNVRTDPWDIGAYQFTASGEETQIPAPPSRLRVILDI